MAPGTAQFMIRGLERAGMGHVPVLAIISDFEGRGAHQWIEHRAQYALCGTSICRQQAHDFGLPTARVFQTSGMVLRPSFYELEDDGLDQAGRLHKLGLDPTQRTILVFWGGLASSKVLQIASTLAKSGKQHNIIFLCGRNKEVAEGLKSMNWPCKIHVEGYTTKVSWFLQVSDMMICKPGPGCCSEAALLGVPMIVEWAPFTLPQEVAVCKWILNRGLGFGFCRVSQLLDQVERMCDCLDQAGTKAQQRPVPVVEKGLTGVDLNPGGNTAVFEVPALLAEVFDSHNERWRAEREGRD
eukprot:CAMPEP_0184302306 /NCGR_PEP_ID=MMETSP1049-20130417/12313_1 /TAXON_ID=77928 /ORGANISM="Proteomonas sulcata, Strain CCMP704" /LENGTH=297 /DNA_ID=CAMNT_0026613567 /DNA_START=9 /DNA_END=902 /DNA_ORIENTATION=-